ncbi:MAG: hypothetical protein WC742_11065 [Gallionellaceae bacterium]|jgi:hypothetical protein
MKIRLSIFALTLLILPPLALFLADQEINQIHEFSGTGILPILFSGIVLLVIAYVLDTLSFRQTGSSLLRTQTLYLFWLSASGALLGMLVAYLNVFTPLWLNPPSPISALLSAAFLGGIVLPAVLITRLWLSSFPRVLRSLTRSVILPALPPEIAAALLLLIAAVGLMGGVIWPIYLTELFWLAPLFLLSALQLLWHESTVFSGLKNGDWSRVLLGATSGILVTGIAQLIYAATHDYLQLIDFKGILFSAGYGLLCLQLGDVIAESWRGKQRAEVFKKKPFPIPVIVKKD